MVALDKTFHFYKNLSLAGGLIYVVAFGVGRFSIDNRVAVA
jgi:putative oxidoreductase